MISLKYMKIRAPDAKLKIIIGVTIPKNIKEEEISTFITNPGVGGSPNILNIKMTHKSWPTASSENLGPLLPPLIHPPNPNIGAKDAVYRLSKNFHLYLKTIVVINNAIKIKVEDIIRIPFNVFIWIIIIGRIMNDKILTFINMLDPKSCKKYKGKTFCRVKIKNNDHHD